jgi:biopolymer transport protein ExbD
MVCVVVNMRNFFNVSSKCIRESGLGLNQHQSKEDQDEQTRNAKAVIVKLCADGDIRLDGRVIDVRSVRANIERRLAEDRSAVVVIETAEAAPTGLLVTALDQARAAEARISVSPRTASCNAR